MKQPRTVTLVYGAVALVILLVIAAVALVISPPAPPSVAEYAPQATERIDEALKAQSSQFGEQGGGECAAGQDCTDVGGGGGGDDSDQLVTTTTRRTIDVKRVRRCVGNPPRQTEDPQSPPCFNYFEGDNGGATARGVTRDEIQVSVPEARLADYEAFLHHFNSRYEFYGRKLRLVATPAAGAAAAAAAGEAGVFAAVVSPTPQGIDEYDAGFMSEAARQGIVSVSAKTSDVAHDDYLRAAPYGWSYSLPGDILQRALGSVACNSLARGRRARFAGAAYQGRTRKFAILSEKGERQSLPVNTLQAVLERCGVSADHHEVEGGDAAAMQILQSDSVTTVLSVAGATTTSNNMTEASKIGYQPEWVISGSSAVDNEAQWGVVAPADQRAHLFGIAPFNKLLPAHDEPTWWALQEGEDNPDQGTQDLYHMTVDAYHSMLVLASGIQAAGPTLTADTFGGRLQGLRFPNPAHGAAPYDQAHVGFGPSDFAMVDDVAVVWWSESTPSYRNELSQVGGWCYVGRGRRFGPDAVPDVDSGLFDVGTCR